MPDKRRIWFMSLKTRTQFFTIASLFCCGCGQGSSQKVSPNLPSKAEAAASEEDKQRRDIANTKINQLVTRHDPIVTWKTAYRLPERSAHSDRRQLYTYELQRVLEQTNGKPVLLSGNLADIEMRDGKCYCTFWTDMADGHLEEVELECPPETACRIIQLADGPDADHENGFVLVADQVLVRKSPITRFTLHATVHTSDIHESTADSESETVTSHRITGRLLDYTEIDSHLTFTLGQQ